ncbi:MAG: hypothetical protein WCY09_10460 [Candidatus Omnitrophota bacterium]|jgi:hypothetical protein
MAKQMNADELAEIMSDQLRELTTGNYDEETIRRADSVANMIGKTLKHTALILAYPEYAKKGGRVIDALEPRTK